METVVLTDATRNWDVAEWECASPSGQWNIVKRRLHAGVSAGVDLLEVRAGHVAATIVPTRGMGLLEMRAGSVRLGWDSPIEHPVHPRHVPLAEPSGYGFLDGPNELMFRCGLESLGKPDFDEDGCLRYPLHGRIANLPAHYLAVELNEAEGRCRIAGLVAERRFLRQKLLLETEYVIDVNASTIHWSDCVHNVGGTPASMQMMYHVNLGPPVLDPGARFAAPIVKVSPRDAAAQSGEMQQWNVFEPPQADYQEQVYFLQLKGDSKGRSAVVLHNAAGVFGACLRFDLNQLPWFTLWKNTQAVEDGFVTGIQPGTSFPNPKSFEQSQGRTITIAPGKAWHASLSLSALCTVEQVVRHRQEISDLQGSSPVEIFSAPRPDFSFHGAE